MINSSRLWILFYILLIKTLYPFCYLFIWLKLYKFRINTVMFIPYRILYPDENLDRPQEGFYFDTSILMLKSYDSPETNYQKEFIRPPSHPTIHQIIPRRYFPCVSGICDIVTARLMDSDRYLMLSLLLPADLVSFENLLLVLMERGYSGVCGMLLTHLSIFYAPFLTNEYMYVISYLYPMNRKSYEDSHRISVGISWFFHLNMFAQYSRYFYDVLYLVMIYLSSIVPKEQRIEIVMLFKPSNYKNYLLHVAHSPFIHFYLLFFVLENYVQYLFSSDGVGNPNFIN